MVPTRNRPERLAGCLEALAAAREKLEFRVWVCDSSTGADAERVAEICARHPFATRVAHDRVGAAAARNVGTRACRARLVVSVDDDVYVEPGAISALVDAYRRVRTPRVVAGAVEWPDWTSRPLVMRRIGVGRAAGPGERPELLVSALLLYPRELAHAFPWNERLWPFDDRWVTMVWRLAGAELCYAPDARARHDERHNVYPVENEADRYYANLFDALFASRSLKRLVYFEALCLASELKRWGRSPRGAAAVMRAWWRGHRAFAADLPQLRALAAAARAHRPGVPAGAQAPGGRNLRVVIAHDFMETSGGAERGTAEMAAVFPDAPVYAILGSREVAERMGVAARFTSLLTPTRLLLKHYRLTAPLLPALLRFRRLPEADVLLTSSYAFAHHLRTRNDAPQVCFCHGPLRFAWSMTDNYEGEWASGKIRSAAFRALAGTMRLADRQAASRVSSYLTQSDYVAEQIDRFYGRQATVVGAPVDCDLFVPRDRPEDPDDFFLFCGRLVEPYKRADIAIEAFQSLPYRLMVVGDGPAREKLEAGAPANVEFTGALQDRDLVPLMQRCQALIFPSQDDFGLLPLEVMACARPVLAFAGGGAKYTVVPGVTGEFFQAQSAAAIAEAVSAFDSSAYDPDRIRTHATNWDRDSFRSRLRDAVEAAIP
ncbi:MAG: glycosyltransferase [Solirubrobacterales bacterium]